ncbi:hypothetical protein GGX14DRAFT_568022 [Mycena pura]|uniref:Bacteriophage T5 Orf172 DNA-binding domain-containing protein n=1 Tax=Mycena pura TaxID=153505 RepID=A0AAD6V9D2_9AGAR|nr:hypothetical protein GGX14DRAFT_568022 [Mycena pura]
MPGLPKLDPRYLYGKKSRASKAERQAKTAQARAAKASTSVRKVAADGRAAQADKTQQNKQARAEKQARVVPILTVTEATHLSSLAMRAEGYMTVPRINEQLEWLYQHGVVCVPKESSKRGKGRSERLALWVQGVMEYVNSDRPRGPEVDLEPENEPGAEHDGEEEEIAIMDALDDDNYEEEEIRDDWLNTDVRARYYAAYIAATHPCPSSDADLAALNTALKVELVYALEVVLDDGRKVFKIGHTMHPSTRLRVLSLCRKRLWGAMWRVPWRIHLETVLHVWFGRAWIGKIRCANCKKRHQEYFDAAACGGRVGVVNAIEGVISLGVKERPADIGRLSADIGRRSADIGRYIFRSGKLKVDQI